MNVSYDEVLRSRDDRMRRALTHIWSAVDDTNLLERDRSLARAKALLMELEDEPWPTMP